MTLTRPDLLDRQDDPVERLKEIGKRARNDYFFLCQQILGYKDLRPSPHQEVCDLLEKPGNRKKLLLMPRNSFKSSCVTVGYPIKRIIENPNIRILISSETQKNAKRFVSEIRAHFEGNQKFKALFGDLKSDRIWRDDELLVSTRTKPLKEATITAASLEKMTVVGQHYDLIILDDPVSQHNVNSQEQIQKTIDHYKLLLSVLEPGDDKQIVVIGTRWSLNDLYGWILDAAGPERDQFDVIQKQAIDDEGNLLLPDVLTREFLDSVRKTQGDYVFNCQYLNRAISSETATFDAKTVRHYEKSPKGLIYFMTVDPAISTKEAADFSGVVVNGVDSGHNWYIQEALALKLDPAALIEEIFRLCKKYQPMQLIGMEKFALEKFLKLALIEEMGKRNFYVPIKELQTDTRVTKEVRIRALQPRFQAGQVYLKKEHETLYNQIVFHPQVKNDDVLDALKSQLAVTYPAPFVEEDTGKYAHLTHREREIWENLDKAARRKVRQTKWIEI